MKAIYKSVRSEIDQIVVTARKNGRTVERIELDTWEWDEFYNDVGRNIWAGSPASAPGRNLYLGVEIVGVGTCGAPKSYGGSKW
jgi:hypothetical protein